MPDVLEEFPDIAKMSPIEMMDRLTHIRGALTGVAPGIMPEEQEMALLREMAVIAGVMRRRSAGPPKTAKKKTTAAKATIADL